MTRYLRTKPTNHVQSCNRCRIAINKGEPQIVIEVPGWRWVDHTYFHPDCFMIAALGQEDFVNHFHKRYGMELNALSFNKVYRQNQWRSYSADIVTKPFELYEEIINFKTPRPFEWLKSTFNKMVFEKVFQNGTNGTNSHSR